MTALGPPVSSDAAVSSLSGAPVFSAEAARLITLEPAAAVAPRGAGAAPSPDPSRGNLSSAGAGAAAGAAGAAAKAKAVTRPPEKGHAVEAPPTAAAPLASRATSRAPPQPRDVPEVARRAPILALALTLTLSQP